MKPEEIKLGMTAQIRGSAIFKYRFYTTISDAFAHMLYYTQKFSNWLFKVHKKSQRRFHKLAWDTLFFGVEDVDFPVRSTEESNQKLPDGWAFRFNPVRKRIELYEVKDDKRKSGALGLLDALDDLFGSLSGKKDKDSEEEEATNIH